MAAPTMQAVARKILRDWGIMSLDPLTPTNQTNPIRAIDLEDVALVITTAFQEIADEGNSENRNQPGGVLLRAPATVTLTCTDGSTAISALTTYSSYMLGCTIRINGDTQDNELLSPTLLALPFVGTGGSSITATVFHDAITLDSTVAKVIPPMRLSDGCFVNEATDRYDFITRGIYTIPQVGVMPAYTLHPYSTLGGKPTATAPSVYFTDGYYDSTQDYIVKRIRLSPMPTVRQSLSWSASINPLRCETSSIDTATTHVDPGVKIPCADGWIESIFLPVARQIATSFPQFKNDDIKQEISRQYFKALQRLKDSNLSSGPAKTKYL